MLPIHHAVLQVLVEERRRSILRDRRGASPLRLRRRCAALVYALASAFSALGAVIDEEPGTVRA